MKRLSQPSDEMPAVYADIKSPPPPTKPTPLPMAKIELTDKESEKEEDVPPKKVFGHQLTKLKSWKGIRDQKKLSNKGLLFCTSVKTVLDEFPFETNQLDRQLLILIINMAEAFFCEPTKTSRDEMKKLVIDKLMLPYYRDDPLLLNAMIESVEPYIIKSGRISRLWKRICNRFHFFLA